jgi:hypothetical protein
MINFLTVVIPLLLSMFHDFHVSVCDVEFNEKSKSIQISQRIFLDDFEQALNKKYGVNLIIDDKSTIAYRDSLIQVYLFESVNLRVDGKEKKRVYVGSEIEEDAIWCFIEYEGVKKYKSITITSTVLLETFEDQANIIHFTYGDKEKSIKLDKLKISGTFTPDE